MSKTRKQPPRNQAAPVLTVPDSAVSETRLSSSGPAFLREHSWLHYVVLAALALLLYGQTIGFSYTLDDPISTTKNRYVQQGVAGIKTLISHGYMYGENGDNTGAYRPLPLATFAVEKELVGNSAMAGHIINVLLYALCAVLVYQMLRKWLSPRHHFLLAFAAAALWVAHPIHTEVVASIKSRDEILALVFICLSALSVFTYADEKKPLHLLLAGIWLFLGMASKESAITFVAVIPLALYFFRNYSVKQIAGATIPLLVAAGLYMFLRSSLLDTIAAGKYANAVDNTLTAATNSSEKYGTAFVILLRYIGLLLFPHPLSYDYSFRQIPIVGFGNIWAILGLAVYAGMAVFALVKLKSKHLLSFCILFFLATISIVSNLVVEIGATLGERFLFVPSLAFCIALVYVLSNLFTQKTGNFAAQLKPVGAVVLALLLAYAAKTITRSQDWKGNDTLFASGVITAPNSARTNFHYGYQLFRQADRKETQSEKDRLYPQAAHYMQRAVDIYPDLRDAQRNLGLVYVNLKEYRKATRHLQHSLRLNDTLQLANFYTGVSLSFLDKPDSALVFFDRELALNPSHALSHHYKGFMLNTLSDRSQDPNQRIALAQQGLAHLNQALALDPKYAESHFQKGYILGKLGDFPAALQSLETGLQYDPKNAQALLFLGIGNGIMQQPEKAIGYLKRAIEADPKMAEAYKNLTYALRDTGRYAEAVQYLQQGLQHNPDNAELQMLLQQMRAAAGV